MKRLFFILFAFLISIILYSCVEKFDINEFDLSDTSGNVTGDTIYVKLSPDWEGFNRPQDIMIGKEPFIYIADTDNDRVVMMNLDGEILGTRSIKKPVALAQDYELKLIVCAKYDTLINNQPITLNAVYKIDLFAANHQIENAPIEIIIPATTTDLNNPDRDFTGTAVFYDNSYLVARKGPNNGTVFNPDNSILQYTPTDSLIGRIPGLDPVGSGLPSANGISSITSFKRRDYDIILTLTGSTNFKVQYLNFIDSREFTGYVSQLSPQSAEMMKPNKFGRPEGATVDDAGNIFIADAEKDTVFKFNSFGDELQSFGGEEILKEPYAVAFFDRTLYVCDTGNNRILRFILSTDLN